MMYRIQQRSLRVSQSFLKRPFNNRDHIESTYLPTFHFQGALPRLPIPPLEKSLEQYEKSLQALDGHPDITREDIDRAIGLVQDFLQGNGPELDAKLRSTDKANPNTSFYYEAWTNMYLSDRRPLPVNYNPVLAWKEHPIPKLNTQQIRAAQICWAAAKYQLTLRDGHLKPEVFNTKKEPSDNLMKLSRFLPKTRISLKSKGIDNQALRYLPYASNGSYPLDMSQIHNLFYSTRIPTEGKDVIKKFSEDANHVIVLSNGRFYNLDIIHTINGQRAVRDAQMIMNDISSILDDSKQKGFASSPVAALSNINRDSWTAARRQLVELGNAEALESIDGAMFCMCLDDFEGEEQAGLISQLLWGPSENRWVDKSFSIIVSSEGRCGLNFEHAWGDGACVLSFFNKVHEHIIENNPIPAGSTALGGGAVDEVHFVLNDSVKRKIEEAQIFFKEYIGGLHICFSKNTNATRKWMEHNKLGADGFLQLSLQITHNQLHGFPCATYESASTCAYHNGRTETIRPCTLESRELCDLYAREDFESASFQKEVDSKLRTAIKSHNAFMINCLTGNGFDRHLFGIRDQCQKLGYEMPDFVKDKTFSVMNHFRMSTSTLNSPHVEFGGFGPVVDDGYALGYMVYNDFVGVVVISKPDYGVDPELFSKTVDSVWNNLVKCVDGAKR